jgi:Tfp pilus assembly protein PilE
MREQSGRSLIEIIGVLAISAIMISATYSIYHTTNEKQKRLVASEELKDIAQKTKTLLEYSGYAPVSVDYLIESGVINNDKAPMGGEKWSVTSNFDGTEFSINLVDLSFDECAYFTTKKFDWVTHISVNGYESSDSSFCMKSGDNTLSFFAK